MDVMKDESTITLTEGDLRAEFWPDAGMLGTSLRYRDEELLRRIDDLETSKRKGSTAGIPLLYPWANRLAAPHYRAAGRDVELDPASPLLHFDDHGLSMHGVPWGQLVWDVLDKGQASLRARLRWNRPELLAVFPFPHDLEIVARVTSNALTVQTTVLANGGSSVPISFGFHPYLGIPDLPRDQWQLQLPRMRKLQLDVRGIPTGAEEAFAPVNAPLGEASYDNGFALIDEQPSFSLAGGQLRITVTFLEGFPYTQVFAPKGKNFIALEPMTAPANSLLSGQGLRALQAGGQFPASFRIAMNSNR